MKANEVFAGHEFILAWFCVHPLPIRLPQAPCTQERSLTSIEQVFTLRQSELSSALQLLGTKRVDTEISQCAGDLCGGGRLWGFV